jgi:hypothetical protein
MSGHFTSVERIDGGKLRCTGATWSDAVVIFPGEVLAFQNIERQAHALRAPAPGGVVKGPPADADLGEDDFEGSNERPFRGRLRQPHARAGHRTGPRTVVSQRERGRRRHVGCGFTRGPRAGPVQGRTANGGCVGSPRVAIWRALRRDKITLTVEGIDGGKLRRDLGRCRSGPSPIRGVRHPPFR